MKNERAESKKGRSEYRTGNKELMKNEVRDNVQSLS